MALKTQGTQVYIIDPGATGGPEVLELGCVTSIDGLENNREQLDATCLDSEARVYEPGMPTPGQATLGFNFDPQDPSHLRMYDLWRAGTKFEMAIGFGDGTAPPTLGSDDLFNLPSTRSWLVAHQVYFANIPLNLALNALVTASVTVQLSGFNDLYPKA